jgi:hypothetical protein
MNSFAEFLIYTVATGHCMLMQLTLVDLHVTYIETSSHSTAVCRRYDVNCCRTTTKLVKKNR